MRKPPLERGQERCEMSSQPQGEDTGRPLRGQVNGWLQDLGYTIREDKSGDGDDFHISAGHGESFGFDVIHERARPAPLIVATRVAFAPSQKVSLGNLSLQQADDLGWDCQADLLYIGCEWQGALPPREGATLFSSIFEEPCSKAILSRHVLLVFRAASLISLRVQRSLSNSSPPSAPASS